MSTAPGVAQRTANRIILDLKGRVDLDDDESAGPPGGAEADVIAALTALGYSTAEARRAVAGLSLSDGRDLEALIRQALLQISSA